MFGKADWEHSFWFCLVISETERNLQIGGGMRKCAILADIGIARKLVCIKFVCDEKSAYSSHCLIVLDFGVCKMFYAYDAHKIKPKHNEKCYSCKIH